MGFERCRNIDDFRTLAKRRLPAPLFHFLDGGADDEVTLRASSTVFESCRLIPNVLAGLSQIDMSTSILGQPLQWPVFLAPTGINRLFHHDGELAAARAAHRSGTMYSLSTLSTTSIEDVAQATPGPKCFQIYIHKDREMTYEFVDRCKAARYAALCLTVDTPVAGNRERDLLTGMTLPPKLTLSSLLSFASHWEWAFNYLTHEKFELSNVASRISAGTSDLSSVIDYVNSQFDPAISWSDAEKLVARWNGPFAIKGVTSVEDARRAADIGATAIMISNHGGRQLDGTVTPFEALPQIAEAVGDKIEIILDGGVRRGSHILKAIALGAKVCSIGRGYLYPLAAGGQPAVDRALQRLRDEVERNMVLMGCSRLSEVTRSKVTTPDFLHPARSQEGASSSPVRAVA